MEKRNAVYESHVQKNLVDDYCFDLSDRSSRLFVNCNTFATNCPATYRCATNGSAACSDSDRSDSHTNRDIHGNGCASHR